MGGYFNLNSTEVILVILFGVIFLLATYGVPLLVYANGFKKVKQKQETVITVVVVAFMFQIIATVFVFGFFFVLDLFGKTSLFTDGVFSQFLAMFFSGDWASMQVDRIASSYASSNQPAQTIPVFLMLKFIWICLNATYLIVPIYFVYKVGVSINSKYKHEMNNSGSYYEIGTDFFGSIFIVFAVFVLHTQVPTIFLSYFQSHNQSVIESKLGASNMRNYTYQGIVGNYIKNSYLIVGPHSNAISN